MSARNIAISQRENYTPSQFTCFLWWLSTAEKELLADSVVDRNRYRIIGMSVLATWIFASFTWTYFFYTFLNSIAFTVISGAFMGFVILTIDRALIKGITRHNKTRFLQLLFRGLLAVTIGTFMAQPAVLFMFDKEIRLQASLDNEKLKQLNKQELDLLYKSRKNELQIQRESIKKELSSKYDAVTKARENFLSESDGSGGTGKIGLKDIAMAKRTEYMKLDEEYKTLLQESQPILNSSEIELQKINNSIEKEQAEFENKFNNGFLTRINALNNLLQKNAALQFRYYLIVFILMLIELMPVIAKTLLPSGSYDEKVMLREEMEIEIANSNIRKEKELKEMYNQMAFENDAEAIRSFFSITRDDRNEKIKAFSKKWKEDNHQTFDGLWGKMKREVLSKQEN